MEKLRRKEKLFRFIEIKEKLEKGEVLKKKSLSEEYGVSEKSIQRDFETLNSYYAEKSQSKVVYNWKKEGYELQKDLNVINVNAFTNEEILAISKILLGSRAFCRKELEVLLEKILNQTTSNESYKRIEKIIRNERFNYIPLKHGKKLLLPIWELSRHIFERKIINIEYTRKDNISKKYDVKPVSIMFSEYYFYLIAYMAKKKDDFPTVFRVDRITKINETDKNFNIPYKDRFEEGEFRKRVQFMYSGALQKIRFEYTGIPEYALVRLPTAKIESEKDGKYLISAEVYGKEGVDMWIRSQGEKIKVIDK